MLVSNRTNRPVDDPTIAHSLLAQQESTSAHQLWALRFGQARDKKFCGLVAWYSAQLLVFLGVGTHIRGGFTHGMSRRGRGNLRASLSSRRHYHVVGRCRCQDDGGEMARSRCCCRDKGNGLRDSIRGGFTHGYEQVRTTEPEGVLGAGVGAR